MKNIQVKTKDIFKTRVWTAHLEDLRQHHECWQNRIRGWRSQEVKPRGKSNYGGWNLNINPEDKEFAPLFDVVTQLLLTIVNSMAEKRSARQISAWVNMHDYGGFNSQHNHAGSVLSACYYLSVPKGSGDLVLLDPRPGVNLSTFFGGGPNCRSVERVKPQETLLVIFPSWLEHWVEPHQSNEQRLSIAMNLT